MKKIFALFVAILMLFCGCIYQVKLRPTKDPNKIWVCEQPYAEFMVKNENARRTDKIICNDKVYDVVYLIDSGPIMVVYTDDILRFGGYVDEYDPYELFRGRVNYEKDCFTLTVEEDKQNIFGGEKPVMKFVKHNKEKYFNGKNIAK